MYTGCVQVNTVRRPGGVVLYALCIRMAGFWVPSSDVSENWRELAKSDDAEFDVFWLDSAAWFGQQRQFTKRVFCNLSCLNVVAQHVVDDNTIITMSYCFEPGVPIDSQWWPCAGQEM